MIKRNDACWCGSNKKWKKCHYPEFYVENNFEKLQRQYYDQYRILIKNKKQIEGIRNSCKLASQILNELCNKAKAGMTTYDLDQYSIELHKQSKAIPAPLGYGCPPFPGSICTSINEVICHGIPDETILKNGDILNIDVTTNLNGYYGDCSRTIIIGTTSPEKENLVDVTYQSMMNAIKVLKPGIFLSKIGNTIEEYANSKGCSVVYQFVSHGVGIDFHEPPQIPHNRNNLQILTAPGMTFTVEPMINLGVAKGIIDPNDKWTARTADGKPSAQFEHTVLITETGHEILTLNE